MKKQKANILNSASRLFRLKGFKTTTLQEIAKELNMEAPSLYNHIRSKQDILRELLLTVAQEFIKGIEQIVQSKSSSIEKLKEVIALHIELSYCYTDTMSLMLHEYIHLRQEDVEEFVHLRSQYEAHFKHILQQCIGDHMLKAADIELMTFTLLSTLRSVYAWIAKYKEYDKKELEDHLIKYLLEGLLE